MVSQNQGFSAVYIDEMCLKEIINNAQYQLQIGHFGMSPQLSSYINEKNVIYVDINRKTFYAYPKPGLRKFIEVVYESALAISFDLENKKSMCKVVVTKPNLGEALMIDNGVDTEIIKITGKHVFPLVNIGQLVHQYSKLCYVVTKKYEVRVIKSPVKGIIFYIGEVFSREGKALYMIIVGEEDVVKLTRAS